MGQNTLKNFGFFWNTHGDLFYRFLILSSFFGSLLRVRVSYLHENISSQWSMVKTVPTNHAHEAKQKATNWSLQDTC